MNLTHPSIPSPAARLGTRAGRLAACLALGAMMATAAHADMYFHPNWPTSVQAWETNAPPPGGISSAPVITSITQQDTNVVLTWYGPQGTYFIESTPIGGPTNWTRLATNIASDFAWSA